MEVTWRGTWCQGAMPGVLAEAHGICGVRPMMGKDGARTV